MHLFKGDLASLLHPVSVDEFFLDYWGKKPLCIRRNNPGYFEGLYSSADIDDCLRFMAPIDGWQAKVKMVIKSNMVPFEVLFDQDSPGFNYKMIRKSKQAVSMVLPYIQEQNKRIFNMARVIGRDMRGRIKGRVNVNAYYSPRNSYITPHLDAHDELNIQLEGTKYWKVYEPRIPNPCLDMPLDHGFARSGYFKEIQPCMEVLLLPGDFIYVPRGYWHDPVNTDNEPSLGLTIGVHPIAWVDTVLLSARAAAERHPKLRMSLTASLYPESSEEPTLWGNIPDLLGTMSESAPLAELTGILERDTPDEKGLDSANFPIPSPDELAALEADTVLSRSGENEWKFHQIYGLLRLSVSGRVIGLRMELKETLEYMSDNILFTPADLPGTLTQQERISFCRFLLNFGAIQFDTPKDVQ